MALQGAWPIFLQRRCSAGEQWGEGARESALLWHQEPRTAKSLVATRFGFQVELSYWVKISSLFTWIVAHFSGLPRTLRHVLCNLLLAESKGRTILEMHLESGLWDCVLRVLVGRMRRGLWEARRRVRGSKGERRGQVEGPLPPLLPVSREDSTQCSRLWSMATGLRNLLQP